MKRNNNKNSSGVDLNGVVNNLTHALGSRSRQAPRSQKKVQNSRSVRRVQEGPGRRGDVAQSLTRVQYTASTPLVLFEISPSSTPGGIRVRGRELVASAIVSAPGVTGAFALLALTGVTSALPLSPFSFPRLTAYSSIYEYYKFTKVRIQFQANQPTTATGAVAICADYDPTDPAPTTFTAMMRNITASMANIYSDCSTQVLGSLSRLPKYETSAAATETLQQIQAQIYCAVEGVTAITGTILGYIILEYEVEFFTPQ